MPWEPEELVDIYNQVVNIIEEVNPDLTIVDPLQLAALTAVHKLQMKWTVLAPNTIKDFAASCQPYGAAMWKYPLINSALPYPIPWSQIPMNVGLNLILAKAVLTDTRTKAAIKLLREQAKDESLQLMTTAELGVVYAPPPGLRILLAFSEDLDYPFDVIPSHISKSVGTLSSLSLPNECDSPMWTNRTTRPKVGTCRSRPREMALTRPHRVRESRYAVEDHSI